jgi:hypothetical protein
MVATNHNRLTNRANILSKCQFHLYQVIDEPGRNRIIMVLKLGMGS